MIRKLDSAPYTIDYKVFKQFDQRQTVFGRMLFDEKASFYRKSMYANVAEILARNQEGYSRIEFARTLASWTIYDYFHGAFSLRKLTESNSLMTKPELEKYSINDHLLMSKQIKETARMYGASLVGICRLDRRWIYSHNMNGNSVTIPKEYEYAIVMAVAMDVKAIRASPTFLACTTTGIGYSHMAFCVACLAEFIRYLGYEAIPLGNDVALSIPLAIDAGLGELGRNGLLITPEYGPCVRLCKVFTDLPLEPDKPIEFGATDFCRQCNKCAVACEVDAIQRKAEPSFTTACPSNNSGILRWAVNHDRCYQFWIENGGECSNCIAACPYMYSNR